MSDAVNAVFTTAVAFLVTSAVATGSGIIFEAGGEEGAGLTEIKAFNQLIQGVYLSDPGTSLTFLWSWCGCEVELVCEGNKTQAIFPTTNLNRVELSLSLPDPASIIETSSYNGTHAIITYGIRMNNLTMHAIPSTVTFSRLHGGVLVAYIR